MKMIDNREVIRNVVGIIGNITSFFLFASPAPTMLQIWKKKSVEEYKYHPIVAGLINCMMWIFYSMPFVHPHSILVTTINGIGLAVYIAYNVVYLICADYKKRKSMVLYYVAELMFMAAMICVTLLAFHSHSKRSNFVGVFCDIFGIILYASPLTVMYKVVKTKSVEFMPLSLSLAGFLNGVVWSAYALIKFDLYILIGNGVGALLGGIQLILYACYCSTPMPTKMKQNGSHTGENAV